MLNSCDMSEFRWGKKMGPNLDMQYAEVSKKPYVHILCMDTLHIDNRNYI